MRNRLPPAKGSGLSHLCCHGSWIRTQQISQLGEENHGSAGREVSAGNSTFLPESGSPVPSQGMSVGIRWFNPDPVRRSLRLRDDGKPPGRAALNPIISLISLCMCVALPGDCKLPGDLAG